MTSQPLNITQQDQQALLNIALTSIKHGLENHQPLPIDAKSYQNSVLRIPYATFVTLKKLGTLRGCIGTLQATRPLVEDVAHNAYAAAFHDPRFKPLTENELAQLTISISILGPETEIDFGPNNHCEDILVGLIKPGIDGLILEYQGQRSTFLPSVWESLPEPLSFIRKLKIKAGLKEDYWSDNLRFYTYQTISFDN